MTWWRRFREFDEKGALIDRVEGSLAFTRRGYVFDRRVFQVYLAVVGLLILYVGLTADVGWREFYLHCPSLDEQAEGPNHYRGACENPYYLSCDRAECRSIEFNATLPAGFSVGNPPDEGFVRQVRGIIIVIVSGFVVAFSTNHLAHNRGKPLEYIFGGAE